MSSVLSPPAQAARSASMHLTAPGAAKISPATLASSMPRPTNPLSPGSWPLPPSVTTRTLPAALGFARMILLVPLSFTWRGKANAKPSRSSGTSCLGSLMNFFIRIAGGSLLLVSRGIGHQHRFAESLGVRGEHEKADHQPNASRHLRGPVKAQPDHCAKHKAGSRREEVNEKIAFARMARTEPKIPDDRQVHAHKSEEGPEVQ